MDNFKLLYFSPTGGTGRVAKFFQSELGGRVTYADDITVNCWETSFSPDETLIVFFPVYGGRVPAPMYERASKLSGNGAKAVIVAVFGNRAVDDALLEMSDILKERGFVTAAGAEIVTRHSLNYDVANGRPDEADKAKIREFIRKLADGEGTPGIVLPGKRPYVEYNGLPLKPSSGKKCSLCLVCMENCPTGAIPEEDPSRIDKSKCISCMRCTTVCTTQVRAVPAPLMAAAKLAVKQKCAGRKEDRFYI